MKDILRPDNHELFDHVRVRLVARHPAIPFEDIAAEFGVEVPELIAWFLSYRLPSPPRAFAAPREARPPTGREGKDRLARLRDREASLVTIASEAPFQLAKVQGEIAGLYR